MFILKYRYLPFVMWFFPLLFFAYQFILRLWPGLMMPQIMAQFSIDASHFGLLAAAYYYGYAGMQIPVAILLDKFGPRYIICAFAILCGIATFIFTYTTHFYLAVFSRFLIGAGSAVGFLGVSKVISEWFPQNQYARMVGLSFSFGLTGAIYGGKPINTLIATYSWQTVACALSLIAIVIGFIVYFALRSPRNTTTTTEVPFRMANFKGILTSPWLWCLAFSNLLMVGALEGFADVWGVPYLMTAYDLEKGQAAGFVSLIFFGMLFGGPLLAVLSKKLGHYPVIMLCGLGMAAAFILLLSTTTYNPLLLSCVFFTVGLLCCYQVIVFAAGATLVAPNNLGLAIAFLNCINMLGGSFFHPVIGKIMDTFWIGQVNTAGARLYDLSAYQQALSIIPACACLGVIIVLLIILLK